MPRSDCIPAKAQELAIEELAERLHRAMEHMEPTDGADWSSLDEIDREFCRQCVKAILLDEELLKAATGRSA